MVNRYAYIMNLGVVKGGFFPLEELATYWQPNIHCQFYHCKMSSSRDKIVAASFSLQTFLSSLALKRFIGLAMLYEFIIFNPLFSLFNFMTESMKLEKSLVGGHYIVYGFFPLHFG
jgi:hypothetical protein